MYTGFVGVGKNPSLTILYRPTVDNTIAPHIPLISSSNGAAALLANTREDKMHSKMRRNSVCSGAAQFNT
jgi:hypothetical protein